MPSLLPSLLLSALLAQPAKNPACEILSAADVSSLVGSGAKTMSLTATANTGTCMYQNGEKIATVLLSSQTTAESAASLFAAKQRIVTGKDVTDFGVKAYAGMMGDAPAIGLTSGVRFVEVRVVDKTTKAPELATRLRTTMKGVASRLK